MGKKLAHSTYCMQKSKCEWIIVPNVKPKSTNLGEKIEKFGKWKDFTKYTEKISVQEKNFYNYNFCSLTGIAKEIKRQAIELEKIFVISILNK